MKTFKEFVNESSDGTWHWIWNSAGTKKIKVFIPNKDKTKELDTTTEETANEAAIRSPTRTGMDISARISARGNQLSAKSDDENPEFHKDAIESHERAIATNPKWAESMLPNMQKRLEYHKKRYAELTNTHKDTK